MDWHYIIHCSSPYQWFFQGRHSLPRGSISPIYVSWPVNVLNLLIKLFVNLKLIPTTLAKNSVSWPCMELLSPRNVIVCPWRWRNFTIDRISKSNNSIMWKISFTWTRGVLSVMEHLAHVDRLVAIRLEQLKRQNGMQWKVEFEVKIVLEQLEGISSCSIFAILNVLEGEW